MLHGKRPKRAACTGWESGRGGMAAPATWTRVAVACTAKADRSGTRGVARGRDVGPGGGGGTLTPSFSLSMRTRLRATTSPDSLLRALYTCLDRTARPRVSSKQARPQHGLARRRALRASL